MLIALSNQKEVALLLYAAWIIKLWFLHSLKSYLYLKCHVNFILSTSASQTIQEIWLEIKGKDFSEKM